MIEQKHYGKLIGASLGPGDPDLITRRAWAALQSGARWLYPVKKAEESSYALGIVRRGGIEVPADAEALVFPMTRDPVALARAWARAATRSVALLREGRDLVFLVEGDASTFSTFGHLARVVRELAPEVEVETIPGVSSFAAAAAAMTAAGIISAAILDPATGQLVGVDPVLLVLATAAGSNTLTHINDASFWLFKGYFDLSVKDTLKTWGLLELVNSVVGLIIVLIISMIA